MALAIATLVVNDHWAKQAHPSFLTGKLSDVAGLLFFPLLLEALVEGLLASFGRYRGPDRGRLHLCIVATAVGFGLAKTTEIGNRAYRLGLGALRWPIEAAWSLLRGGSLPSLGDVDLVRDPTDLVAFVAFLGTLWVARRRVRPPSASLA